ncbi:hypothetical protein GCM10012275_07620 [Longimycelium tulufanense]|uniref:Microcin J25-processing protein McjB C-terminal domain-containing protein n=1 Tax=Longimycelium tulufanense TaxID=907463 RepID=A0A8J3FSS8_9PSEU|nr:lasso peptide biosynthesis B2 protein [Longimycelium tulufanense]GGM39166.1 hypothetical protein GCM10012275_07620 [Longimycelium tulufanense]
MTEPVVLVNAERPPWRVRFAARVAVQLAQPLTRLTPAQLRRVLRVLRGRARPATQAQALAARNAVVTVSAPCASPTGCLRRSLAAVLLCRGLWGVWPTWSTGVRTNPFRAHAWIEVGGTPVGETFPPGYYRPTLQVGPKC